VGLRTDLASLAGARRRPSRGMGNCEYGTRLHPVSEARILHHIPTRRRHRGALGGRRPRAARAAGFAPRRSARPGALVRAHRKPL